MRKASPSAKSLYSYIAPDPMYTYLKFHILLLGVVGGSVKMYSKQRGNPEPDIITYVKYKPSVFS